jgi:hypothetical protein
VPAIGFAAAAGALAIGAWRWRRAGRRRGPGAAGPSRPQGEDAERLEQDLARYDL